VSAAGLTSAGLELTDLDRRELVGGCGALEQRHGGRHERRPDGPGDAEAGQRDRDGRAEPERQHRHPEREDDADCRRPEPPAAQVAGDELTDDRADAEGRVVDAEHGGGRVRIVCDVERHRRVGGSEEEQETERQQEKAEQRAVTEDRGALGDDRHQGALAGRWCCAGRSSAMSV